VFWRVMNTFRWMSLAAVTAALIVPTTASAGTVSSSGGEVRYTADAGERNAVIVTNTSDEIVVEDQGASLAAAPGCTLHTVEDPHPPPSTVHCPRQGVDRVVTDMGNRDDRVIFFLGGNAPPRLAVAVVGGSGADTYTAAGTVTLDGVANDGPTGQDNIGADVENVVNAFEGVDDRFTGNDAANRLESPGGTDVMSGAGGDDYINTRDILFNREESGELPPDQIACGPGSDVADVDDRDVVAADCELVIRRDGVVRLTDATDTFRAPRPGLTIFGLAGNDVINAGGARSVSGGDGDDKITLGSALDITASGNDGNDRIYGLVGRDRIIGGAGNDKLYGERSNDRIDGGSGRDGIDAGRGDDLVRVRDGETDRVHCSSGRDRVIADRRDRVQRDCERVSRR
jgi:Ca2+-binding RTX toxin-like protein